LNEGDLIFARTGATVWKSFLMNEEGAWSIFASYLIRIIPDKKQVSSKFLSYFFQCEIYRNQIYEDVVGAAQPNFNGTKLSKIQIPLPSLEHQQKIVAHLDETFSHLNQLKSAYEQKLTRLQELKASILAESFFK
jgi:type I restriction enzyme S subunit